MPKRPAPTKKSAMKTIHTAFDILIKNGGEMPRKNLLEKLTQQIKFEAWELERYESNGQLKWLTIFLFYSIDCIKAGWLIKNKGIWQLTDEGKVAYKLGAEKMLETASKAYRDWKNNEPNTNSTKAEIEEIVITDTQFQQATIDELKAQANEGIGKYLDAIDAYKFQELCSALLKAMGFYIDYIAKKGKDGGIDIVAFKDTLGFEKPKIKVQVKKRIESNKNSIDSIKLLKSNLHKGEDIGIFITGSSFTNDARIYARNSDIHIKLIDRTDLIELWQEHYSKLSEKDKALLPIQPIYFLGSLE